jgi:hypothetical protein
VNLKPPTRSCRFSEDARCRLRGLGLIKEQIAELEEVLPFCRLDIADAPRLQDVRAELKAASRTIERAFAQTRRLLLEYNTVSPIAREAMNRIQKASHEAGGDCCEIERARDALVPLDRAVTKALADLPKEQRRTRAAAPRPVKRIDDALIRGWGRGGGGRAYNLAPDPEIRDGTARITRRRRANAKRKFEEIVQICYDTIGAPQDYFHERAIKLFWRLSRAKTPG